MPRFAASELATLLASPFAPEELSVMAHGSLVVVDMEPDGLGNEDARRIEVATAALPCVMVAVSDAPVELAAAFDVALAGGDAEARLETLTGVVERAPLATLALVQLLRGSERRSIDEGLAAESWVYAMLQRGPEHAAWLASRPPRRRRAETGPAVLVTRDTRRLVLTLNRPHVHNAFDVRMRDELLDVLRVAATDDRVEEIVLRGDGPTFCSGGDLDEFGTTPDPATANAARATRGVGRWLAACAPRVRAELHGACVGAGIEMPAFVGTVVATQDTTVKLPELTMGLVPGAGGTVSIPRRVGRQRAAELFLSAEPIDAATARAWGLVDAVVDRHPA